MVLTTPTATPTVEIQTTAPTVVAPGTRINVTLQIRALQACELTSLAWKTPETIGLDPDAEPPALPASLQEGDTLSFTVVFLTDPEREDFGELEAVLRIRAAGSDTEVAWAVWISVFEQATASDEEALSDPLRDRLIAVVNALRAGDDPYRNGHIFLADPVSFFADFLNIEIPARIATLLLERGILPSSEGIPVNEDIYLAVMLGVKYFYGIVRLELIPEEECEESDDRFDPDDAREVSSYEINL